MAKPLTLPIGSENLVVDPDGITLRKVKDLAREISEVRNKYNPITKHPMLEGEAWDDYEKRVKEELTASNTRKVGESEEDFVKRILSPSDDNQSIVFDQLKVVAKIFGQESKVTEDSYDNVPYIKARDFITDLLVMCDLA